MAAKINWHRYGTKLRHCHSIHVLHYIILQPSYIRCSQSSRDASDQWTHRVSGSTCFRSARFSSSSSSFYLPNNTTVCTSTSMQLRRAGQQGPTRALTAALKRVIKQLLGTYSITQVKYNKQIRQLEKSVFSNLFLKHLEMWNLQ